MENKIQFQHLS